MKPLKETRQWARWTLVGFLGLAGVGSAVNGTGYIPIGLFVVALIWAFRGRHGRVAEVAATKSRCEQERLELREMQGLNEPGERDRADRGYGR
jgi:hypothetical protein